MNWIGMLIGAGIGLAVGWTFRCTGGACPLTSTWWVPMILGAVLGLTWKL